MRIDPIEFILWGMVVAIAGYFVLILLVYFLRYPAGIRRRRRNLRRRNPWATNYRFATHRRTRRFR